MPATYLVSHLIHNIEYQYILKISVVWRYGIYETAYIEDLFHFLHFELSDCFRCHCLFLRQRQIFFSSFFFPQFLRILLEISIIPFITSGTSFRFFVTYTDIVFEIFTVSSVLHNLICLWLIMPQVQAIWCDWWWESRGYNASIVLHLQLRCFTHGQLKAICHLYSICTPRN